MMRSPRARTHAAMSGFATDLLALRDRSVFHHFLGRPFRADVVVTALKPGGRVVLVEYRGEDIGSTIRPLHKMTEGQARMEMEAVGLRWCETKSVLPLQHLMIFKKP